MDEFSAVIQAFDNQPKTQILPENNSNQTQNFIQLIPSKKIDNTPKTSLERQRDIQIDKYIPLSQNCAVDPTSFNSILSVENNAKSISSCLPQTGLQYKDTNNDNITKANDKNVFDRIESFLHPTVTTTTEDSTFNDLIYRPDPSFDIQPPARIPNAELHYDTFQKSNIDESLNDKIMFNYNKHPTSSESINGNANFLSCPNIEKHCETAQQKFPVSECHLDLNTANLTLNRSDDKADNNTASHLTNDSDSSSSVDMIDLDISDVDGGNGYQDNTSSHSQQSIGGGSGSIVGNNGPNSSGNSSSNGSGGGGGVGGGGGGVGGGGGGGSGAGGSVGNVINVNPNSGYISLLPPPVGTTGSAFHGGEGIDFKHLFEELCPVCGDKVSGYHYGLLTCESCKGFFKRTVQNKKVYTCVAERSCHIDKTQRKRCPYCRFQKCLEVGMKLEAVRADRMRGGRNKFGPMYKRDRARKLQMMRQRQLALQAIRTTMGSADIKGPVSPTTYQQPYPNMNIKQEIQIPQVSSLTQSPDSSPSPIAIALGQVHHSSGSIPNTLSGSNGSSGASSANTHENVNRNDSSTCPDGASVNIQHTSDSKICFDSNTNPSSTADSIHNAEPLRVSPMIREFVQSIDDREWQTQLFALLQKQSYNQVEVDLFELMCKVLDQNLFSQVDWARNTVFFKDLKVDDQMKLLQHSWSDMLVLDHLHQRIHNGLPDETQLNNGQIFNLLGLGLLGVPQLSDYFNELQNKLQDLKFDMGDYVCMKFLILLNPNVRGIINRKTVLEGHENVQAALLDYTLTCYPSVTDKFSRLLNILPEIHAMAARGEEHLYLKHCAGSAPTQTLLMEMLHAKRKV